MYYFPIFLSLCLQGKIWIGGKMGNRLAAMKSPKNFTLKTCWKKKTLKLVKHKIKYILAYTKKCE